MEIDKNIDVYDVPATLAERASLRKYISAYMGTLGIEPPFSMEDLSAIAVRIMEKLQLDKKLKGWLMVEIHNQGWKTFVSSIPYERRLLLLPKCLSNSSKCQAEVDEYGLLCHQCGHCMIPDLEKKAEELGVMSMVAEGFTSVVELIRNRVVDCVIGVSCLNSLEKAFPLLISHAVPGLAVPLNYDGCHDTQVDYNYVLELLTMHSEEEAYLLDYNALNDEVQAWFTPESLSSYLTLDRRKTSEIALRWMEGNGKRWRPYLLAATYSSLAQTGVFSEDVKRAAIGIECFHKASLIHDDIQDNDDMRYEEPTVHAVHGIPMAINVGDALLGEGYKLLSRCENSLLIAVVAKAHLELCQGQGMELEWSNCPEPITLNYALDIFRKKTVPAFEVALQLGLICAGGDKDLEQLFHAYSLALGVAYQLQDDVEDFIGQKKLELRPSAVLAVLCEENSEDFVAELLKSENLIDFLNRKENLPRLNNALNRVQALVEVYRQEAFGTLYHLKNVELKRLLFRITERILNKKK